MHNKTFDLSTEVCEGLALRTPLIAASGTTDQGRDLYSFKVSEDYGAICTKAITVEGSIGNPPPRIAEVSGGLLNSIGMENLGIEEFIRAEREWLHKIRDDGIKIIANVAAREKSEVYAICDRLEKSGIADAVELNLSCPNVEGMGRFAASKWDNVQEMVCAAKSVLSIPVLIKLSPVLDVDENYIEMLDLCRADAIVAANTYPSMIVEVKTAKPYMGGVRCGLSGPAIFPMTLRMVWEISSVADMRIVFSGGVCSGDTLMQAVLAGACAVQIGSMRFIDPLISKRIINDAIKAASDIGISSVSEAVGLALR